MSGARATRMEYRRGARGPRMEYRRGARGTRMEYRRGVRGTRMEYRRGAYWVLMGRSDGKTQLGSPGCRWEGNIKSYLQEVVWGHGHGVRFDVRKSVHHHTSQINQPTRCNSFTSLLLDVYVRLNVFRAPLRPSSEAYNCTRNLWFYRWSVAVGVPTATLKR